MIDNLSFEKILVTGGTGFLGWHTVENLVAQGIKPIVLTRNLQTVYDGKRERAFDLVKIDLLDTDSLKTFLEQLRPSIIVHLAGTVQKNANRSKDLERSNFEATSNLLKLARVVKVKRIIITGTADEYGFQPCPQTEKMVPSPVSDYAVSKNKSVNFALSLYEKCGLPVVILRPFTIYGIGQSSKMFVSQAIGCAVKNMQFEMSNGVQKRDLLFVTDFANAIIKTLTAENIEGEVFNVGSGRAIALREVAEKIWKIAGADNKLLKIGARFTNDDELHDTEADITKIKRILDWQPKITIDEGLTFLIDEAKKDLK